MVTAHEQLRILRRILKTIGNEPPVRIRPDSLTKESRICVVLRIEDIGELEVVLGSDLALEEAKLWLARPCDGCRWIEFLPSARASIEDRLFAWPDLRDEIHEAAEAEARAYAEYFELLEVAGEEAAGDNVNIGNDSWAFCARWRFELRRSVKHTAPLVGLSWADRAQAPRRYRSIPTHRRDTTPARLNRPRTPRRVSLRKRAIVHELACMPRKAGGAPFRRFLAAPVLWQPSPGARREGRGLHRRP
jgi:hypothetical protein